MFIVISWYFNGRDNPNPIIPEISGVFGPFSDVESATKWADEQLDWGGWGRYEFQIQELISP